MKKIDYYIRQGKETDFEKIDRFDPFEDSRRKEIMEGRCIIVESEDRVIGFVTYHLSSFFRRPFVHYLAVDTGFRRCGVANVLIEAVERKVGIGRLFISTEEDNTAMLKLLEKARWISAGCVSGVNDGNRAECFFYKDL